MIDQKLYLKNGVLFARGFERLVHGERGSYVELTKEQILLPLLCRFKFEGDYSMGFPVIFKIEDGLIEL